MARRIVSVLIINILIVGISLPSSASSVQYNDASGIVARRWLASPIIVAFSRSLDSPPPNIKAGSDVVGAAHRALEHWSKVANIQFVETTSALTKISPQNAGDGVNLITVSADNVSAFGSSDGPGRTRVFHDSGGAIIEADIALNPAETFSTDGTAGTYDLESTLTHEVGHLIGLEHSAVIGATMQPRQAKNGVYGHAAFTQRTLSEDDIAGARSLYGSSVEIGSISGKLMINQSEAVSANPNVVVFAEDFQTGKVVAATVATAAGDYQLGGLAPGSYRLIAQTGGGGLTGTDNRVTEERTPQVRTFEISRAPLIVKSAETVSATPFLVLPPESAATVHARMIGTNGELSTVAVPLEAGKTFTIYVAGEGLDQLAELGISTSSPLIKIVPKTLTSEEFGTDFPVVSFQIRIDSTAERGDYSLRLQTASGELSYLPGAITIR